MWDVGLASMFKERDNKGKIGPCVGAIVSVSPLKVNILNGEITLQGEQIIKCSHVTNLVLKNEVVLLPTENEQTFFLIGKVGG